MEKRINKKISEYTSTYKVHIKNLFLKLGEENSIEKEKIANVIQTLYDYPSLCLTQNDFQKRKRIKNIVPLHERCCALKAQMNNVLEEKTVRILWNT